MGVVVTMCCGVALMFKRWLWKSAGYDLLGRCHFLYVDHCRYFHFAKEKTRRRTPV